ncbi:MAG: hypothetical protein ACM3NT_10940 [Methylocystaceae bacterium]
MIIRSSQHLIFYVLLSGLTICALGVVQRSLEDMTRQQMNLPISTVFNSNQLTIEKAWEDGTGILRSLINSCQERIIQK